MTRLEPVLRKTTDEHKPCRLLAKVLAAPSSQPAFEFFRFCRHSLFSKEKTWLACRCVAEFGNSGGAELGFRAKEKMFEVGFFSANLRNVYNTSSSIKYKQS
jgi:hypothetical protein